MAYKFKLLVIDDEQAILDEIKNFFEKRGEFTVETALTGEEGVEKLRKQKFEVVLVDLGMPNSQLSGLDVIQIIDDEEIFISIGIITGHGDRDEAVTALKLGAEDWFQKGTSEAEMPNLYKKVKRMAQVIPDDKYDDFMNVLNHKNAA